MRSFGSRHKGIGLWLSAALVAAGGAGWWWVSRHEELGAPSVRTRQAVAPRPVKPPEHPPRGVDARLWNEVRKLEGKVQRRSKDWWGPELEARRYGAAFIDLWNDLRKANGAFAPLKRFELGSVVWGDVAGADELQWGIRRIRFSPPTRNYGFSRWLERIEDWEAAGYKIEASEWRQARFVPRKEGDPRSVMAFRAHVLNQTTGQRAVLTANLDVSWRVLAQPNESPHPATIRVRDLVVLVREEAPAFEEVVFRELVPGVTGRLIDPLMVHDLDENGRDDLIFGCFNLAYWNHQGGRFESGPLLKEPRPNPHACVIGDFDSDRRSDFLVADPEGLWLYRGRPSGGFSGSGTQVWRAPAALRNTSVITAGDIDGDGDLDLWLAQYKLPYLTGQMPTPFDAANDGFPSFLLENDGGGLFRDATVARGLSRKRFRRTYSASFADLDADTDLDLVVVSDFAGTDIYRNRGDGTFEEATAEMLDEPRSFGMAHNLADYDGDGRMDLFVVGMNSYVAERLDALHLPRSATRAWSESRRAMAHGNRLYLHRQDRLVQGALSRQLARSGWSWGAATGDFDNDGDLDVYVVNGHKSRASVRDYETRFWCQDLYLASSKPSVLLDLFFRKTVSELYRAGYSYGGHWANRLFLRAQGPSFDEVGFLLGLAITDDCRNVLADDFDLDGALDLVVTTSEVWPRPRQTFRLFQNRLETEGNWIEFRFPEGQDLVGLMGATIRITGPFGVRVRQIISGDGYRSQSSSLVHFGLGTYKRVDRVEIQKVGGALKRIMHPPVNRVNRIGFDAAP